MLIAILPTVARRRDQSTCPSADERIMKMRYGFTKEYYLTAKKKKTVKFAWSN